VTAPTGRLLGLDVGERRIGVAITDPEQRLAVPLRSVVRDGRGGELEALAALVLDEEVAGLVVGLPLTLRGEAGAQAATTQAFAEVLGRRLGLPVLFWDERLSTREALQRVAGIAKDQRRGSRSRTRAADTDALAASIILQAYLDSLPGPGGNAPAGTGAPLDNAG
jgi:putative Holliday junction resolvase